MKCNETQCGNAEGGNVKLSAASNHGGGQYQKVFDARKRRLRGLWYPLIELCGRTIGIIGMGRIGRESAKLATAFGMNVLAYNNNHNGEHGDFNGFKWAELDEIFKVSDIISLHCPLTAKNRGFGISAKVLKLGF